MHRLRETALRHPYVRQDERAADGVREVALLLEVHHAGGKAPMCGL